MKRPLATNKPLMIGIGLAITAGVILLSWWVGASRGNRSALTYPSPSPSPAAQASPSPSPTPGRGNPDAGSPPGTPTPLATPKPTSAPSGPAPSKPVGQVLNTNTVSLSATSGPQAPYMESSVVKAAPGSTISVVAVGPAGQTLTVAQGGAVNESGQVAAPINWNAKDAGLTPGTWQVKLRSHMNGQTTDSDAETLTVQP